MARYVIVKSVISKWSRRGVQSVRGVSMKDRTCTGHFYSFLSIQSVYKSSKITKMIEIRFRFGFTSWYILGVWASTFFVPPTARYLDLYCRLFYCDIYIGIKLIHALLNIGLFKPSPHDRAVNIWLWPDDKSRNSNVTARALLLWLDVPRNFYSSQLSSEFLTLHLNTVFYSLGNIYDADTFSVWVLI